MKLLLPIFLFLTILTSCQDIPINTPYPNLEFDQVIAYKMKGMEGQVIENGKL